MSAADVEFVRGGIEAGNAAGWEQRVAWEPYVHPEVRFHTEGRFPGPDVYEGRDGFEALIHEWMKAFEDFRLQIDRLIDADAGVVALMHAVGKSTSTGLDVDWPIGAVFCDFADGGPREVRWFTEWAATLADAGLPAENA
jgi:SnoaL-like domain